MNTYAKFLISKRKSILFIFLFILLSILLISIFIKSTFLTGIGDIKNSDSLYVKNQINSEFKKNLATDLIIVNNKSTNNQLLKDIISDKNVESILSNNDNPLLKTLIDDKSSIFFIKLKSNNFSDYEQFTPILREKIKKSFPDNHIYVTGNAAFSYDMNYLSEKQGKEAEAKVLIITIIVLFLAFGSISGAFIAVSAGFITTLITISLLKVICIFYPLSVFSQNISAMLGLGLSIDYSLLIITRLRKEIKTHSFNEALNHTLINSGKSVIFSGITVMIGFTALFIPRLNLSDSIAIGGSIVSLTAILISLTYTPLMLYLFKNYLDYPFKVKEKKIISEKFGHFVSNHSLILTLASIILLLIMIYPVSKIKLSEPDINVMPEIMESKKGFLELQKISKSNLLYPVEIIVESNNVINDQEFYNVTQSLKKYPLNNIYTYFGDIKNTNYTNYFLLKNSGFNIDIFNELNSYFLSNNKKQALIISFPDKNLETFEINNLIKDLKNISHNNFKIYIGGQAALGYDLITNLYRHFDIMIIFVYLLTSIILYFSYRSVLIPIKAIIVNTFSVLACYGVMVLIFQDGYLSQLFNLTYIPGYIISGIPVILFCIMFSLSMDYEVFLLSSIYEEYQNSKNNKQSVINGLINTSGVITKAALVMLIVFVAFIQADIILIKMLGVGLTFAVLIDSTLIRLILVPSMMNLAGKYNWLGFKDLFTLLKSNK